MTDTRAKKFIGTSVELDAIPAASCGTWCAGCIERHVDKRSSRCRMAENSERELLKQWAGVVKGVA